MKRTKDWTEKHWDRYTDLLAEGYEPFEAREVVKHLDVPQPDRCDECGASLELGSGYVGEAILYCPRGHGIKWGDSEGAIRRVI